MATPPIQKLVFQHIKNKLPAHLSLVDEIASVLKLSTDSAYRRIRGEKCLDLEEVYELCIHFQLSLDHLLNLQSESFMFSGSFVQQVNFKFDQYLKGVTQHLKYITGFRDRRMFTLCKDIPLFHHFHFREIAAFKHYVWMRAIMGVPEYAQKKFSLKDYPAELFELGQKALQLYSQVDTVEIWNIETINSTLRQIEFYHDSKLFVHEEEVIMLYEAMEKLILHLDKQAELGYKFAVNDPRQKSAAKYQLYFNEMVIGDNSILAILDDSKIGFIIHTVINIMMTKDARFCDNMHESMQNLMKRSTLISAFSERERSRFFKYLRNRINNRKLSIKS